MIIRNNNLSMSLIKMNIIQAKQAISYFDNTRFKNIKNSASYEIQQACEKLIKIQIYNSGVSLNYYNLYTHNLTRLYEYGLNLGIDVYIPRVILSNLDKISSWEAGSRYDIHFSIRIDILKKYLKESEDWYDYLYKNRKKSNSCI